MVKRFSKILLVLLLAIICVSITACNDNKEKVRWAEKINDRHDRYMSGEAKAPYVYAGLVAKLNEQFGESNYGSVTNEDVQAATGILYWIDGDYSKEEIEDRIKNGKKLKGLAVSFALGLAVDAYYGDLKDWL